MVLLPWRRVCDDDKVVTRRIAIAGLIGLAAACRTESNSALDSRLESYVPGDASILAGANLARVRSSVLYPALPAAAKAFLEPLHDANTLLIASDGGRFLALARGRFREAPAGATLIASGVAAAGSGEWVQAASKGGHGGGNPLLAYAAQAADAGEIWMVASGKASLPLSGNGENVNRLLHATQYAALTLQAPQQVTLEAMGMCRTPEIAQHLEETLRAYATLGAAGTSHQPALSALLRRIRVTRDDRAVHMTLTMAPNELQTVFQLL